MSEPIVITNSWQIRELEKAAVADLAFGKIGASPMSDIEMLNDNVDSEQLNAILSIGRIAGDHDKIKWLYYSTQTNISTLFSNYRLTEDGVVDIPSNPIQRYQSYVAADASFHSVVTSAKRFITKTEQLVQRYFGENSEQYAQWRNMVSTAYDESLVYSLLYDLRNCVEHDFWIISMVNIDEASGKAGLAINIDNNLMNLKGLKRELKQRLRTWAKEQADKEMPAWFSLGKCLETYRLMILALYTLWVSYINDIAASTFKNNSDVLFSLPGNIVLWTGANTSQYSATGQYRAYRIWNETFLRQLEQEKIHLNNLIAASIRG